MDAWYTIFNDILSKHAPIRQKRIKYKIQPKWFNSCINNDIQNRDYLFKKAKASQNPMDWSVQSVSKKR